MKTMTTMNRPLASPETHFHLLLLVALAAMSLPAILIVGRILTTGIVYGGEDLRQWTILLPFLFLASIATILWRYRQLDTKWRVASLAVLGLQTVAVLILGYWFLL
jgi:hypothetical protein